MKLNIKGKELQNIINESIEDVMKSAINEQQRSDVFTDKILESVLNKVRVNKCVKLNEATSSGLWAEIRFVQGGDDDYEEIEHMFCGDEPGYCVANSQPVIDYLKQWDGDECEITANQPRIARHDTSYADENGEYTLLYNSSVGGCFLLYRPANEQEISWYEENGTMNENKNHLNESVSPYDYAEISDALAECGWSYVDAFDVRSKSTGKEGVRYILEPYPNNNEGIEPLDVEQMKERMTQLIGQNNVIFSEGQHRQAPEIKNLSMVVF